MNVLKIISLCHVELSDYVCNYNVKCDELIRHIYVKRLDSTEPSVHHKNTEHNDPHYCSLTVGQNL